MVRFRLFLLTLLMAVFGAGIVMAAEPSAKSVVDAAVAKLRKAPSVRASFTAANASGTSSGALTVSGNRFAMSTPELRVWFDGKTQWAYSPASSEVNVSEPTAAELGESNPLAVLTNLTSSYSCRRLTSPAGSDKIELTPTSKTDIAKAVITFSKSTGYPTEIVVTGADGAVTTIRISSLTTGGKLTAGAFRFKAADYPGVQVVDLR